MASIKALDVSKHQHSFDPVTAKAAGIDAVITRLAYAASPDRLALSWCPAIKAAGLRLGAFGFATWHYLSRCGGSVDKARQLMIQQVDSWITQAQQHGVDWWFGLDQECESHRGERMALDKAVNTAILNEACDRLAAAGLHQCVYCSTSWDKQHISTADLRWPYWFARYVDGDADFGDPGADLDRLSDSKTTAFMRRMRDEGRLVGWQYGSTGHGHQYGAGSDNIDRNIFYLDVPHDGAGKDENSMDFVKIEGKQLDVTSTKPACQSFAAPTVETESWYNLPIGQYPITAQGDTTQLAGMTGTWYKIDCPEAKDCVHVLALPDRCAVIEAPEPVQPAVPDTPAEPVKPAPVPVILQPRLDLSGLAADLRRLADAIDGGAAK